MEIYLNASFVSKIMGFFGQSDDDILFEILKYNPWIAVDRLPEQPESPSEALVGLDVCAAVTTASDSDSAEIVRTVTSNFAPERVEAVQRAVGIERGKYHETAALNRISSDISRPKSLFKKVLLTLDIDELGPCSVVIGGRVDGILGDKVVETKNRRAKLFGVVPAYERVQVQLYMFLTDLKECIHIENYDGEQNVINVAADPVELDVIRTSVASRLRELLQRRRR